MPGESPTKWQAQAYRFGVRRLESAVSSGDPLLRGDPVRRRLNIALIVSVVLAALILGGFAVYGFVRPEPSIGDAAVVIDSDTGGAYVARDGRLYPAMNYASAMLAAGHGQSGDKPPSVAQVNDDAVGREPRGPLLGIPGAPNVLPSTGHLLDPLWTVCDDTTSDTSLPPGSKPEVSTTAVLGRIAPTVGELGTDGMLVSVAGGKTTYLLWTGGRSKIDLRDNTIRLAFDLRSDVQPRPISAALLNVIPQNRDIAAPSIDTTGPIPQYAQTLGVQVGEVFGLQRADRSEAIYVALPDGVQPVTPLVGDLIRDRYDQNQRLPLVAPQLLRDAPRTDSIDLSPYPSVRPRILDYPQAPVACVFRTGSDPDSTRIYAMQRVPLPANAKPVSVTEPGSLTVNSVYLAPGKGAVLAAATQKQPAGALYVITDEGVGYPVVSGLALSYLGYRGSDVSVSSPELLSLLPKGPALDPDQAVHFYPQTGATARSLPSPPAATTSSPGG
ncbi:MAG TPA: type VII secretion protein EccB [Jatrophihabitans sp.]|jgi:type VII secretion protein EccB